MSFSADDEISIFRSWDGRNPYAGFRVWKEENRDAIDTVDSELSAMMRLLTHSDHSHDLRPFQSVRDALEMLREELANGEDLPQSTIEGVERILTNMAPPPEIDVREIPAPEPAPLQDHISLADEILDLALRPPEDPDDDGEPEDEVS